MVTQSVIYIPGPGLSAFVEEQVWGARGALLPMRFFASPSRLRPGLSRLPFRREKAFSNTVDELEMMIREGGECVLVSHSSAFRSALAVAQRVPDQVQKLIAVAPIPLVQGMALILERVLQDFLALGRQDDADQMRQLQREMETQPMPAFIAALPLALTDELFLGHYFKDAAMFQCWAAHIGANPAHGFDPEVYLAEIAEMAEVELPARIEHPVTVIMGQGDFLDPQGHAAKLFHERSRHGNVKEIMVEPGAHMLHLVQWRQFLDIIAEESAVC
jgi:pimeloyl-ACP methyl ester carboxylesterase